jgi:hypothetical protein
MLEGHPKMRKKRKECLIMRDGFKVKRMRSAFVGGLLLLISLTSIVFAQAPGLTLSEKEWLSYIREEEKLARDVYLFLYDKWQLTIFANISKSEQTHMDAIKTLLDRYGLPDPAADKGPGEFDNQELQTLFDELTKQGSASPADALKVGVVIEEKDIADLTEAIAVSRRRDIKTVYSNLLQGSLNHLKAFTSNLANYGVTFGQ